MSANIRCRWFFINVCWYYVSVMALRYLLLLIYISFAAKALHAAVYAAGPWERRMSFAAMFIMRLFILCLRYTPYGGGHPEALYHVSCKISGHSLVL
ncbi:hypothetical protein CEXT_589862 [Caerostris extrusa]|uniref:Secreted protein n=1 Tax=Caerostris extrusa TaxID=172846 RepID=A0AAV4SB98_CAEEX|nr:hypothetical protein CEXT_589862 [Caerostris extrusa]